MEYWDLFNCFGNHVNQRVRRGDPIPAGHYHLAVDIWIVNSKQEFLIQRRASTKRLFPNIWATTGGSVLSGETSFQGCIRETKEEIGIDIEPKHATVMSRIIGDNTFWDIWVIRQDFELRQTSLQLEEVSEVKWVSRNEIMRLAKAEKFLQTKYLTELFEYVDGYFQT